jgi:ubiquinone biosynthesis protein
MHPGNVFVSFDHPHNPQYIAVDFGIVGTLSKSDQRYLAENMAAFFRRDYRRVAELHLESGWVPATTRVDEFESAVRVVCEPIFEKPLKDISFGYLLLRLLQVGKRFHMELQPQLLLLQKTLLHVESLGRQLDPELDLWKTAKPFLETWIKQQLGVKAFVKKIIRHMPYWLEKLPSVPDLLYEKLQPKQIIITPTTTPAVSSSFWPGFLSGVGVCLLLAAGITLSLMHHEKLLSISNMPWYLAGIGVGTLALGVCCKKKM